MQTLSGLLGDTSERNYSQKLQLFNAFAEPELRQAISDLQLQPGMQILDAGCGAGESLGWFFDALKSKGTVVGMDLSAAHVIAARACAPPAALVLQANLIHAPLAPRSFDLVWCANTINHVRDPLAGLLALCALSRPGGRVVLGQTGFLPDMVFAWDSRLERLVTEAVRQYFREKYRLNEEDVTATRALVGLLRRGQLHNIQVRTLIIERISPLREADERYLNDGIFRGFWGERLRPYLATRDFEKLTKLCDPQHPDFALRRPDFHFLQTFTLAMGEAP